MRNVIVGVALLVSSPPIAASPAAHDARHKPKTVAAAPRKNAATDFAMITAIIDKLFPPQPDPDPARLALSRTAVATMWPDGSYGTMVTGLVGGVFDRAMQLKGSDLMPLNKPAKAGTATDPKDISLHDSMAAHDPYFDQRSAAIRAAIEEEAGKLSALVDPSMREGLSRAMARRFDAQQLADINAFFATPSGRAFAGQYLQLWLDPDAIRSMFNTMPAMMGLMPELKQKIKAADDKFPKPPKPAPAKPEKPAVRVGS